MKSNLLQQILKRHWVLHPYLFAAYVVLAPLAHNIGNFGLAGVRALLVSVIGTIFVVVILRLLVRDAVKAGLISSALILMVFSYGHVKTVMQSWQISAWFAKDIILAPVWILGFGFWVFWVLKKSKNLVGVSGYLNWVGVILIIFPLYQIGSFSRQIEKINAEMPKIAEQIQQDSGARAEDFEYTAALGEKPDIYYIILDAYAREDMLAELYGYDNSNFTRFLEEHGFYVAKDSQANYLNTVLSLSSSTNMSHVHTIPDQLRQRVGSETDWMIYRTAGLLIRQNLIGRILKEQGYTTVVFESGYGGTQVHDPDIYVSSPNIDEQGSWERSFEFMLLDTSLSTLLTKLSGDETPFQSFFDEHRERILFSLNNLANFADADGDYFVFAHIIAPHNPYVFGSNGEAISDEDPFTLLDLKPPSQDSVDRYLAQLHYLNSLVMATIEQILEKSDTPPIIILQADHGSRVYQQSDPSPEVQYRLIVPILNAYHWPGVSGDPLYETITPVNTFRLLLNYYFGGDLDLLDDSSYVLVQQGSHSEFIDACDVYPVCPAEE
jgi:hypothetical protein